MHLVTSVKIKRAALHHNKEQKLLHNMIGHLTSGTFKSHYCKSNNLGGRLQKFSGNN